MICTPALDPLVPESRMADFVVRVGSQTLQGRRANNEDRLVADAEHHLFLVADGMGGQDFGEVASGIAADVIPRVLQDRLAAHENASKAVQQAIHKAHEDIMTAN